MCGTSSVAWSWLNTQGRKYSESNLARPSRPVALSGMGVWLGAGTIGRRLRRNICLGDMPSARIISRFLEEHPPVQVVRAGSSNPLVRNFKVSKSEMTHF